LDGKIRGNIMFVGRENELQRLKELKNKKVTFFIIVRGRRRIGKTRLINEFGKCFDKFYSLTGPAPNKRANQQNQRDHFSTQIARALNTYVANFTDWSDAFHILGGQLQTGGILVLFDEISWMGAVVLISCIAVCKWQVCFVPRLLRVVKNM